GCKGANTAGHRSDTCPQSKDLGLVPHSSNAKIFAIAAINSDSIGFLRRCERSLDYVPWLRASLASVRADDADSSLSATGLSPFRKAHTQSLGGRHPVGRKSQITLTAREQRAILEALALTWYDPEIGRTMIYYRSNHPLGAYIKTQLHCDEHDCKNDTDE